jgi:hypothetical protein
MNKAILWGLAAVFLVWFFYAGIPIDIYSQWSTAIFLIAGISTGITATACFIFLLPKKEEVKLEGNKMPEGDNSGYAIFAVFMLFLFGFPIFLIFHQTQMESDEIKNYGELSYGHIVNGNSYKTRKADFSNLTVQYQTKEGTLFTEKCDISAQEFSKYALNQEIPIVYSKRYPSFFRIIRSDAEIAKYSKTKIRDLTIKDFLTILDLQTPMEIDKYLNQINKKWDYQNGGDVNSNIYFNKFKNIALKVTDKKELIYMHSDVNPQLFDDEIAQLGFVKNDAITDHGILYTNGNYILNKRMERLQGNNSEMSMLDYRQVTLIDILKTK